MTFNELFGTVDERIEKSLKSSNDWLWESVKDFQTGEFENKARLYFDDYSDIYWNIKGASIELWERFHVKDIGLVEFKFDNGSAKYYIELIERCV